MQEKFHRKLILPVAILAIVGVAGATYTLTQGGTSTANAATTNVTKAATDKEVHDETVSPQPGQIVNQTVKADEKEQVDKSGVSETEDGN